MNKYFRKIEFSCKCGCGFDDISTRLTDIAYAIRVVLDKPLVITSGCRCIKHNETIRGASEKSLHTRGEAIDLRTSSLVGVEKIKIIPIALAMGATGIGIYKSFIHISYSTYKVEGMFNY